MGDPQVTMGLNTKSCSNLGDLGYPHDLGNLHLGGEDERMIGIIRNHLELKPVPISSNFNMASSDNAS